MAKLTAAEVVNATEALKELIGDKVSPRAAFRLQRLARELGKEAELVEKQRAELVDRHAAKDEEGKPLPVEGQEGFIQIADVEQFRAEVADLYGAEVEVGVTITLDDLPAEISTQQMLALAPLVVEAE